MMAKFSKDLYIKYMNRIGFPKNKMNKQVRFDELAERRSRQESER